MSNTANAAASVSRAILDFCSGYASSGYDLARIFLIAALVVALVETGLTLWSKAITVRAAPQGDPARVVADPTAIAKLLDALRGLLEALTKLPAWIAIFLAGLALLWMSAQRPEICAPPPAPQAPRPSAAQTDGETPAPRSGGGGQPAPARSPPR